MHARVIPPYPLTEDMKFLLELALKVQRKEFQLLEFRNQFVDTLLEADNTTLLQFVDFMNVINTLLRGVEAEPVTETEH